MQEILLCPLKTQNKAFETANQIFLFYFSKSQSDFVIFKAKKSLLFFLLFRLTITTTEKKWRMQDFHKSNAIEWQSNVIERQSNTHRFNHKKFDWFNDRLIDSIDRKNLRKRKSNFKQYSKGNKVIEPWNFVQMFPKVIPAK